jgi:branched-chain amino acid transport system substrate-binding protein
VIRLSDSRPRGVATATAPATALAGVAAIALGALALASLAGCGRQDAVRGGADAPFAIGVGAIPGSPGYNQVVRGVELAVERLNRAGGVRFAVRAPDREATSAVRVAQQLRDDPRVIAVVGHPESGNTLEVMPIYADAAHDGANGLVAVSPTASSPRLSGISPWFFRVAPSDADAARFTARWVLDSLGARRAAVIYRNDSYGRDWAATFGDTFAQGGGAVVLRDPYLTGVVEWDAYAALVAAEQPDVLLFPGDGVDALALIRALRARGVTVPFVGGDGTETMNGHPDAVGARFVAFFRPEQASSPEAMSFLPRYRERFQQEPDMFAALSYDAAIVIGRTVASGARTRGALRLALERVGNGAPSVDGVAGRIAFLANHDIKGRSVVITRIVGEPSAARAETTP